MNVFLKRILINRAAHVDWNTELVAFTQEENVVRATLCHADGQEESVRARYIIGCEGSNSLVRKTLNLSFEGGRL